MPGLTPDNKLITIQGDRDYWLMTKEHAEWFIKKIDRSSVTNPPQIRERYVELLALANRAIEVTESTN